jgi:hypothetical protein
VRPRSADSVTDVSSVANRLTFGIAIPFKCAAAPSSVGAGILLQSTSIRLDNGMVTFLKVANSEQLVGWVERSETHHV